jgi:hypothetical protein
MIQCSFHTIGRKSSSFFGSNFIIVLHILTQDHHFVQHIEVLLHLNAPDDLVNDLTDLTSTTLNFCSLL